MQMRRGFSIFLILFFGFGPLSALVDGSEDTNLPPCCRRHGAHHCAAAMQNAAMMAQTPPDPRPGYSAPLTCPYYPGATIALLTPAHAMTTAPARLHVGGMQMVARVFGEKVARSIPSDAYAGRGPPRSNLI